MVISKREGKCSQEVFWECVSEIGWPVKNTTLTGAKILRAWTPEFTVSFREILSEKASKVFRTFEEYEELEASQNQRGRYHLSDDGMSDFSNHVVGMGKTIFEEETKNPEKLFERAVALDYEENFSYAIPYPPFSLGRELSFELWMKSRGYDLNRSNFESSSLDDRTFDEAMNDRNEAYLWYLEGDWRNIKAESYANKAERFLRSCEAFQDAVKDPTSEGERVAAIMAGVLRFYFKLLVDQKTQAALDISEEALRSWWHLYYISEGGGDLRDSCRAHLPMRGNRTYAGENIINDHRQYMGELDGFKSQFHFWEIREEAKKGA